jgi:hypothetical protein
MTDPTIQSGGSQNNSDDTMSDQANIECAAFQASMAERIGEGEDLQSNPHMLTCERCRALVRELEQIADAVRSLMPREIEPDENLWSKIEFQLSLEHPDSDQSAARGETEEKSSATIALDSGLAFEGGIA